MGCVALGRCYGWVRGASGQRLHQWARRLWVQRTASAVAAGATWRAHRHDHRCSRVHALASDTPACQAGRVAAGHLARPPRIALSVQGCFRRLAALAEHATHLVVLLRDVLLVALAKLAKPVLVARAFSALRALFRYLPAPELPVSQIVGDVCAERPVEHLSHRAPLRAQQRHLQNEDTRLGPVELVGGCETAIPASRRGGSAARDPRAGPGADPCLDRRDPGPRSGSGYRESPGWRTRWPTPVAGPTSRADNLGGKLDRSQPG